MAMVGRPARCPQDCSSTNLVDALQCLDTREKAAEIVAIAFPHSGLCSAKRDGRLATMVDLIRFKTGSAILAVSTNALALIRSALAVSNRSTIHSKLERL